MKILVDGSPAVDFHQLPDTLAELINHLGTRLKEQDRAILSISIDGEKISYDDLTTAVSSQSLESINAVEVLSRSLPELALEQLDEIDAVLPELAPVCRSLAELFQSGGPKEGYEQFEQLASIWQDLKYKQRMVAQAVDCSLGDLSLGKSDVGKHHQELNTYLQEAAQALQAEDRVLLADLLEYELAPRAEEESKIVQALRERVEERTG